MIHYKAKSMWNMEQYVVVPMVFRNVFHCKNSLRNGSKI